MVRRLLTVAVLTLSVLFGVVTVAYADQLEDDTRRIGKQLQCPVCSGAPVSDSPSDLAGQMRAVIRTKLQAGESDEQIIGYFVERYGDSVLMEPPRRGFGLVVWGAPIIVLIVGGLLLWRVSQSWLRRRRAPAFVVSERAPAAPYRNGSTESSEWAEPAEPSQVTAADRARAELEQFRRGA
jgi:cytochrome c-type biogenesis protein CcmH